MGWPKAFHAFVLYRDLAAERTCQEVAQKLRCSGSNVRKWAARWNWYGPRPCLGRLERGGELFGLVCQRDLEGIVAKWAHGLYQLGKGEESRVQSDRWAG